MATINLTRLTIEELFKDSRRIEKCPHIRKDDIGPYCGKGFAEGSEIKETRRMICDVASLQLWCLTPDYGRCIYFQGEEI